MIKVKSIFTKLKTGDKPGGCYLLAASSSAHRAEHGGMLVEMLLSLALAAVMLPFIVGYQRDRITRAENIALVGQMNSIHDALERYMELHKKELLIPIGKNITRVKVSDLEEFGANADIIAKQGDKIQVRILKSGGQSGHTTLRGIIVLNDRDITPIRTREIVNMGDGNIGFVEDGAAYGGYGTWRASASDLGVSKEGGIIQTTVAKIDAEQYLWRMPSTNQSDATMLSPLNLGWHNILGAKFFDTMTSRFDEVLKSDKIVADKIVFGTRTTIDKGFETADAVVSGNLASDSKNMEVASVFTLSDSAKLNGFVSDNLWVTNLNLSGLSIASNDAKPAILKVNQAMDMVGGYVTTLSASVNFAGSIAPKLVVSDRIEDASNPEFYWDAMGGTARFSDANFAELNRMASLAVKREAGSKTSTGQTFGTISTNKNATAADFMNAINEIQNRVRAKYRMLNLE